MVDYPVTNGRLTSYKWLIDKQCTENNDLLQIIDLLMIATIRIDYVTFGITKKIAHKAFAMIALGRTPAVTFNPP